MSRLADIEWREILVPETPPLEILVRGTLTYLGLFLLLRVVLKRQSGALGVTDLLVVVLIADAAQNAMANDYRTVPDGLLLVAVIVGWAWVLDWLGFHIRAFERFTKPPKLPLIENGQLRLDNMRKELVTREELASQLREQGVDDVSGVRVAYMEPDGRISVLTEDGDRHDARSNSQPLS
ncbi:MAG: DUF421 domain-containing protein [Actinomycetota bacterium]|nr:DUF421 domain-containing protein [Actinomycetota bacterium]